MVKEMFVWIKGESYCIDLSLYMETMTEMVERVEDWLRSCDIVTFETANAKTVIDFSKVGLVELIREVEK